MLLKKMNVLETVIVLPNWHVLEGSVKILVKLLNPVQQMLNAQFRMLCLQELCLAVVNRDTRAMD